jgi:adenylate kinase family enzyme
VVWFDYPRRVALPRVLWRVAKTYGRVREDLAPGCPEKVDWEFLRYVWDFPGKERPRVVAMLAEHGRHLQPMVFRRDRDVALFLDGLPAT